MNNNYIEVLTIDITKWNKDETYKKGEDDFYNMTKYNTFEEAENILTELATKAWEDADETGTDEMRYFLIVEAYGEDKGREYWTDIHTDIYRVGNERKGA